MAIRVQVRGQREGVLTRDVDGDVFQPWGANRELQASVPVTSEEALLLDAAANAEANEAQLETVLVNVRAVASGSGTFASAATRDAAIRACARAVLLLWRTSSGHNEGTD